MYENERRIWSEKKVQPMMWKETREKWRGRIGKWKTGTYASKKIRGRNLAVCDHHAASCLQTFAGCMQQVLVPCMLLQHQQQQEESLKRIQSCLSMAMLPILPVECLQNRRGKSGRQTGNPIVSSITSSLVSHSVIIVDAGERRPPRLPNFFAGTGRHSTTQ